MSEMHKWHTRSGRSRKQTAALPCNLCCETKLHTRHLFIMIRMTSVWSIIKHYQLLSAANPCYKYHPDNGKLIRDEFIAASVIWCQIPTTAVSALLFCVAFRVFQSWNRNCCFTRCCFGGGLLQIILQSVISPGDASFTEPTENNAPLHFQCKHESP